METFVLIAAVILALIVLALVGLTLRSTWIGELSERSDERLVVPEPAEAEIRAAANPSGRRDIGGVPS